MRSIIEEIYYGNISPSDRDIIRGGTYSHILNLVTRNNDELVQTLTQAQQETFDKFKDCVSELGDKNEDVYKRQVITESILPSPDRISWRRGQPPRRTEPNPTSTMPRKFQSPSV